MSKRRRQAAWGHPCLPQPAVASPAVGSPPTGRTSPCKLFSLVLVLALSPLCTLLAQAGGGRERTTSGPATGTIAGVVTAQETGAPLPGARVMVTGTELAADAAADGRYTIAAVPPGTYRLRARLIGHALMEMTDVVVAAGDTARADFRLTPLAVTLSEVVVVGYGTQARRDVTGSVASVSGEDVHAVPKANAIEVEDTAVACLEFAGGAVGTLDVATSAFPGFPRRVELTGSEGTIVVERDQVVSVELRTPLAPPPPDEGSANASATSPVVSDPRGHRRVLEDFVSAIRTGAAPLCDGRDGRRSVELAQAVYRSARTGAAVAVRDSPRR